MTTFLLTVSTYWTIFCNIVALTAILRPWNSICIVVFPSPLRINYCCALFFFLVQMLVLERFIATCLHNCHTKDARRGQMDLFFVDYLAIWNAPCFWVDDIEYCSIFCPRYGYCAANSYAKAAISYTLFCKNRYKKVVLHKICRGIWSPRHFSGWLCTSICLDR